jgi:hypothetical protein
MAYLLMEAPRAPKLAMAPVIQYQQSKPPPDISKQS